MPKRPEQVIVTDNFLKEKGWFPGVVLEIVIPPGTMHISNNRDLFKAADSDLPLSFSNRDYTNKKHVVVTDRERQYSINVKYLFFPTDAAEQRQKISQAETKQKQIVQESLSEFSKGDVVLIVNINPAQIPDDYKYIALLSGRLVTVMDVLNRDFLIVDTAYGRKYLPTEYIAKVIIKAADSESQEVAS